MISHEKNCFSSEKFSRRSREISSREKHFSRENHRNASGFLIWEIFLVRRRFRVKKSHWRTEFLTTFFWYFSVLYIFSRSQKSFKTCLFVFYPPLNPPAVSIFAVDPSRQIFLVNFLMWKYFLIPIPVWRPVYMTLYCTHTSVQVIQLCEVGIIKKFGKKHNIFKKLKF